MAALLAVALAGCSLLYNPNNLPNPSVIDAPPVVADVNPSKLELVDIAPNVIDEGQGDLGSAPALLVLRGHQMVNANLHVVLAPPPGVTVHLEPITDALAAHDGDYLAFSVTAHVDEMLASDVPLDVTVTQQVSEQYGGGTATGHAMVTLHGLPELTSTSPEVTTGGVSTAALQQKYSRVDLTDATTTAFLGSARAEITAVSSIALRRVWADAQLTLAGPGGHPGGSTVGEGPGGGGRGGDASLSSVFAGGGGGGGGGAGTAGAAGITGAGAFGAGGGGGGGGPKTGDDSILSFDANAACAGGAGGMGGTLVATETGGAGGGGGGMIVLTAGGDITTGAISANGGEGTWTSSSGGAGGGGGAGGTVVVRTDSGTLRIGTIHVLGGDSGEPGGGSGSVGRVRWDAPAGSAPSSPDRAAHRGPAFTVTRRVFTTQRPSLTLSGTSNDGFNVRVIDQDNVVHDGDHASFNSAGIATIAPLLHAGYNRVCVTIDGGMRGSPEADKCIDVAFLP